MEQAYNWQQLGKADYAQAAALIQSLPEEVRQCIKGVSHELLLRILHLSWLFATKSGRGAAYCYPTLATLARWLSRSERTVERHLCVLRDAGLISYRRRQSPAGGWTSNLYQMGKTFMASLFARKAKKTQQFRDPTFLADNNLKKGYNADAVPGGKRYEPPAWMLEPATGPKALSGALASSSWGEEKATECPETRKLTLKQQAAALIAKGL